MATCGSCEWYGMNGSVEWCYHVLHNWSTHKENSACNLYSSKW